jgi:glycosyltransferase involved in cell wall biosynthesis
MRLLIYIALYERPEVTRMCLDNLQLVSEIVNHDIEVFCVVSTEDDANLCEEYGINYHYTENKPLGRKMNRGLRALMSKDFDYLIQCGSDDLIYSDYFDFIEKELGKTDYFGVKTYYPVDLNTGDVKKWTYDVNHPIGLGRCVSKKALKEVLKKGDLWPNDLNIGLDTHSDVEMIKAGYRCKLLDLNKPYLFGLKSGNDLHSFEELKGEKQSWKLEGLTEVSQFSL